MYIGDPLRESLTSRLTLSGQALGAQLLAQFFVPRRKLPDGRVKPFHKKLIMRVRVVVGLPVDVDGFVKTLSNEYLGGDLPETILFGHLIAHKSPVKERPRRIPYPDDHTLMLS